MDSLCEGYPAQKRVKQVERWEASIYADTIDASPRKSLGLKDLFGGDSTAAGHRRGPQSYGGSGGFFTLRLEHREGSLGCGGNLRGEERLLVFRSDRAGAIAKIIISSEGPKCRDTDETQDSNVWRNKIIFKENENWCEEQCEFDREEMSHMAQAKIHVLDVKEPYRGRDIGGLLFSEAITLLRERYKDEKNDHVIDPACTPSTKLFSLSSFPSVFCQLDAEEDTRRHNKLIHFYENLGCHVKPHAKIKYLNNNDGETYRKVPMQIAVRGICATKAAMGAMEENAKRSRFCSSLVGHESGFLPIQLLEANGRKVRVSTRSTVNGTNIYGRERRLDWIITDEAHGVSFRTTHGRLLCAEPCGSVVADRSVSDEWESFKLRRVPDADEWDSDNQTPHEGRDGGRRRLFTLQTSHGTFLTIDPETHALSTSHYPIFWICDVGGCSLKCTFDTPLRRGHYRKTWSQGVSFVRAMREKYLQFELKKMGICDALQLAKRIPCHRFHVKGSEPSLRSYLFHAAEEARNKGHPDWIQLIALVHGLARVLSVVTSQDECSYDWTLTSRSRVVGCAPPDRVVFSEYRSLDPDSKDAAYQTQYGSYEAHCGTHNLLLTWNGPEYMYFFLKKNNVCIPEEGLTILRLFPLSDWHSHNAYEYLVNRYDDEVKPFVSDFDNLIRRSKRTCVELSDYECDQLWEDHYSIIMAKYNCDGELSW